MASRFLVASFLLAGYAHGESAVYKLHTDSQCASAPTIRGFQESPAPSCSAITTCTSVNIDGEELYWDRACTSDTYDTLSESSYGDKPYVLLEIYESGGKCAKLLSGAAFLADGSCLVTDNGVSSTRVSLLADGSATFVTYRGVSCRGTAMRNTEVTKDSITSHSCENGALKFYSSYAATTATASSKTSGTTSRAAGSDKAISTATSESAPRSFDVSILLSAAIPMSLAMAITLQ